MSVRKGDIYWVDILQGETVGSEQYGRHPFLVISRSELNGQRTVVGIPFTSQFHKAAGHRVAIPAREVIKEAGCQSKIVNSVALTDQIRVLDKSRLEQRIGKLSDQAIIAVEIGLSNLFDIPS